MNPGGLFVSSSGNVGIGTITPTVNGSGGIQIYGSSQRTLRITGNSNNANSLEIGCDSSKFAFIQSVGAADRGINFYTGDASNLLMTLTGSNVGIGTTNPVTALNVVAGTAGSSGRIRLTHATSAAQIDLYTGVSDGIGIIVNNNPLWFEVSGSEKMRITSGGNVGIGTTNPSFILDVNDTSASGARGLRISTSSTSAGPALFLYINSGAQTNWAVGNSYEVGNALEFRSSNSVGGNPGATGTTRMLITNGGYVGIGTNNPLDRFVVDGGNNIWTGVFRGTTTTSQSFGIQVFAGTNSSDTAFRILNGATTSTYMLVRGDGNVGIGTSGPSGILQVSSANSGNTQVLLVRNYATSATGNFTGNYTAEIRATSNGNVRHGMLIHNAENDSTRRVLDITSLAGNIMTFSSAGATTWGNSTYMISGTTGFRFNNSTDAFNNFVALDNGNATFKRNTNPKLIRRKIKK